VLDIFENLIHNLPRPTLCRIVNFLLAPLLALLLLTLIFSTKEPILIGLERIMSLYYPFAKTDNAVASGENKILLYLEILSLTSYWICTWWIGVMLCREKDRERTLDEILRPSIDEKSNIRDEKIAEKSRELLRAKHTKLVCGPGLLLSIKMFWGLSVWEFSQLMFGWFIFFPLIICLALIPVLIALLALAMGFDYLGIDNEIFKFVFASTVLTISTIFIIAGYKMHGKVGDKKFSITIK
jgi:hypothetical protein